MCKMLHIFIKARYRVLKEPGAGNFYKIGLWSQGASHQ